MSNSPLLKKQKKREWVLENRGILQRIATDLKVTRAAVQGVFMYEIRSKHFRIERALAEHKAPFMAELLRLRESGGQTQTEYREMDKRRRKSA